MLCISSASFSTKDAKSRSAGWRPPLGTGFQATPFRCKGAPFTSSCRPTTWILLSGEGVGTSGFRGQVSGASGFTQRQRMSLVPVIASLQAFSYLISQFSSCSSAARTQTWPKDSQYLSQRPPKGSAWTSAMQSLQVTASKLGQDAKGLQHSDVGGVGGVGGDGGGQSHLGSFKARFRRHPHNMSEVSRMGWSQRSLLYFTAQSSFTSSAAMKHSWPKDSQYLSQRPP
mmetsp:Transcript_30710/g.73202  ORF Transcript_30710/g.73202 Transcript_30710/m.73202 type:complete len:228 (-) Transcript_30710:1189-1872(-)